MQLYYSFLSFFLNQVQSVKALSCDSEPSCFDKHMSAGVSQGSRQQQQQEVGQGAEEAVKQVAHSLLSRSFRKKDVTGGGD